MPQSAQFLAGKALWTCLQTLARSARAGQRLVATAYLGQGARKLLPLGAGDTLLCALSLAAARAGTVDPREVEAFRKRGVRVFTDPDLHAKVYLLGSQAIVGSANLSRRSRDDLEEAGVLVTARDAVQDIRRWFQRQCVYELQEHDLKACLEAYRPPRLPNSVSRGSQAEVGRPQRVYLLESVTAVREDPPDVDRAEREAEKLLTSRSRNEVHNLLWYGDRRFLAQVQPGDFIVQLCTGTDRRMRLEPAGKLLRKYPGRSGTHLFVELPKRFRTIPIKAFNAFARPLGLQRSRASLVTQVRNREVARQLLAFAAVERLRRR